MNRVFVTGTTGFVGLNLVSELTSRGTDVVGLVRDQSPTDLLPTAVEPVVGDLTDPPSYQDAMDGCDTVIHLAATSQINLGAEHVRRVNLDGTLAVADAAEAADVSDVVFTSTIWAHPTSRSAPDVPDPDSYVHSKVDAEKRVRSSDREFDFSVVYPTHVMGPRDYRLRRLGLFYRVAANRVLVPPLYVPGEWNVVHVADVVDTVLNALNSPSDRLVAAGRTTDTVTLCRCIADHVSSDCRVISIPYVAHRHAVIPLLFILRAHGAIPDRRYEELKDRANVAVPPKELQGHDGSRSLEQTVSDSYDWYSNTGVLGSVEHLDDRGVNKDGG